MVVDRLKAVSSVTEYVTGKDACGDIFRTAIFQFLHGRNPEMLSNPSEFGYTLHTE